LRMYAPTNSHISYIITAEMRKQANIAQLSASLLWLHYLTLRLTLVT